MEFKFTKPSKATKITFTQGTVTKFIEDSKENSSLNVGIGKSKEATRRTWRTFVRKTIRTAHAHELENLVFDIDELSFDSLESFSDEEMGREFSENTLMANYEFTRYKSKKKSYTGIKNIFIENVSNSFKRGLHVGQIVGEEVNFCRDLANTPASDMTPSSLAASAQKRAKGTGIKVTVLEKKDVQKLGMGLILGVDQGSIEPLKFIIMEYWGAGKTSKQKPIVLIGKGITFDTGGINLKPTMSLLGMDRDMSGGAATISTIVAIAKLKVKKNVVVIVPAVENAISGSAYRPGDILTSMSGKTVEIINTDAEGRLILGDALTYAEKYSPRLVVDIATLTGAVDVALGKYASAVMTKQLDLEDTLRGLGEESGDYVWPLPLWEEYKSHLKSHVADITNSDGPKSSSQKAGGCIAAGMFLAEFTEKFPAWAHLDIASRDESTPLDNLTLGAAGVPVRLLVRLLEQY